MLDDNDHAAIDEMVGRYLPSEKGDYLPVQEPTGTTATVELLTRDTEQDKPPKEPPPKQMEIPFDYCNTAETEGTTRLVPVGSIYEMGPSRLLQQARVSNNSQTNWRRSAHLLQQAIDAGQHTSEDYHPGLRTRGESYREEKLPSKKEVRPVQDTATKLRLDYQTRFVKSSKPSSTPARKPICAARPEGLNVKDTVQPKDLTVDDIAEKPPPLDFVPHCAYIRNFVARYAGTRQG